MAILTLLEFSRLRESNPDLCAVLIREQAPGAMANGTRIEKAAMAPGDAHKTGERGVILGSIGPTDFENHTAAYVYFVAWDDMPEVPCFVASWRIAAIRQED